MIRFRKILENDLEMIMRWRTKAEVTRYMKTDLEYDLKKQRGWYENVVKKQSTVGHWVICQDKRPIGVLSLAEYDRARQQTSWGYYLGELDSWHVGAFVPVYFYNYMFFRRDPQLQRIVGEVFTLNNKMVQIHRFHGCKEIEHLKDHVTKHGQVYGIIRIELSREDWTAQQPRFGRYHAEFEE